MDTNIGSRVSVSEEFNGPSASTTFHAPFISKLRSRSIVPPQMQFLSPSSLSGINNEPATTSSLDRTPVYFDSDDTNWLLSSVRHNKQGYARSLDVIDLWSSIGVTKGSEIFLALGLNPHGQVNLSALVAALNEELTNPSAPASVLVAAVVSNQQEVKHLKSLMDESKEENRKLQLNLSEAKAYISLMAHEVDEGHAEIDKAWETKLLEVDKRYQEQIKILESKLDTERESGAADITKLQAQLKEVHSKSAQEKQQLVDKLASSQKQILDQEKALAETSEKLLLMGKQNENLKKDLHHKLQYLDTPDDQKRKTIRQQQLLVKLQAENKKLRDENDELLAELDKTRQNLLLLQKNIEYDTNRLSLSSLEVPDVGEDNPMNVVFAKDLRLQGLGKRQRFSARLQSLEVENGRHPTLSEELNQCMTEEVLEQKLQEMEQTYKVSVMALEDKHIEDIKRILDNFDLEKKSWINEQKTREEALLTEQHKDLQTEFAKEKHDLLQKHESEINYIVHNHKQEIQVLQSRLLDAESITLGNGNSHPFIHVLKTALVKCQDDINDLENQNSDLDAQLQLQDINLRQEFEEKLKVISHQFSLDLEQQRISHRQELGELLTKGAENLTGRLRDDFLSLVKEHAEREISLSQAAMLNQLQKDRDEMITALEQEKLHLYDRTEKEREALTEKYEEQIASLKAGLNQVNLELEDEKLMSSEISLKSLEEGIELENALENLRTKMEEELVVKLAKIKESFKSEKRELEAEKVKLKGQITELESLLAAERLKTTETYTLKETIKCHNAKEKEMEKAVKEMNEKMYQQYQQMNVQNSELEIKLKAVTEEAESKGRMDGIILGREEGLTQVWLQNIKIMKRRM